MAQYLMIRTKTPYTSRAVVAQSASISDYHH